MRTQRLEQDMFAEGVEIENLSEEELVNSVNGVGDYKVVDLVSSSQESEKMDDSDISEENSMIVDSEGVIRYEIKDGKVRFSVVANLPESDLDYNVWLKEVDGTAMREVFSLVSGKGGYVGSASLPEELLPFEVIVSQEVEASDVLKNIILRGVISAEDSVEMEAE